MEWTEGTGRYFDPDQKTTYGVIGTDGKAIMVFTLGSDVGRGRTVVRTPDGLVIRDRQQPLAVSDGELRLTDGLHGFWETSGREIFTTQPVVQEQRPVKPKKRGREKPVVDEDEWTGGEESPADHRSHRTGDRHAEPAQPVVAPMAAAPEVVTLETLGEHLEIEPLGAPVASYRPVFRSTLAELLEIYRTHYRIARGAGGVTVLVDKENLRVHTHTSSSVVERLQALEPQDRAVFWRELRYGDDVQELQEVTVHRQPSGSVARYDPTTGWTVSVPGAGPKVVHGSSGYVVLDLSRQHLKGKEAAINGNAGAPDTWHGYIGQEEKVFAGVDGKPVTVMAVCPLGTPRQFDAVLGTPTGPRVLRFLVSRGSSTVFHPVAVDDRPYVVATDQKGKVRVFMRP